MHPKNFLLTGPPGSGKTTIIRKVVQELNDCSPVGFYTLEIRKGGIRQGFELVSLEGERHILAHVHSTKGPLVSHYRVDVEGFEAFLSMLSFDDSIHHLFVIDEIGKMEWFSVRFRSLVSTLLDSSVPLLATIALHGNASMEAIKRRIDVELIVLTKENRGDVAEIIIEKVRRAVDH